MKLSEKQNFYTALRHFRLTSRKTISNSWVVVARACNATSHSADDLLIGRNSSHVNRNGFLLGLVSFPRPGQGWNVEE